MARLVNPDQQFFDDNGDPLAGGTLTFYVTGTTTDKDTFSDSGLTTANTNPLTLDAAGRAGDVFMESGTYRVILKDSNGNTIWDMDPVDGAAGATGAVSSVTASTTLTVSDGSKLVLADTSAGDVTITLPSAATAGNGFGVTIKKTTADDNIVTIDGNGAETIDDSATITLVGQYQSVEIRCDGSNWHRVGRVKELPTGTVQFTIDDAAPSGWLILNGDSIGDTGSGATKAGSQYEALYALFWNSMADAEAAVSTGRGASAQADWDAGKTLTMPDARGRAVIGTGTGSGLTARTHGDASIGAEDATLPSHTHGSSAMTAVSNGAHTHQGLFGGGGTDNELSGTSTGLNPPTTTTTGAATTSDGAHTHSISGSTDSAGVSATDANMMPSLALNVMIKI